MENNPATRKHPTILGANLSVLGMHILLFILSFVLIFFLSFAYFGAEDTDQLTSAASSFSFSMISTIATELLCMLPVGIIYLHITKRNLRTTVRLRKGINGLQVILLCVIGFTCIYFANSLNDIFLMGLEAFGYVPKTETFNPTTIPQLLFSLIVIGLLPAICEEFLFRGVVLRAYERYSPIVAALMSALLFAVMHATFEQVFFAFILGLVLAAVVMITDSIWAGFTIHLFNNALASIINYQITSAPTETPNALARLVGDMMYIAIGGAFLALALFLFIIYTKKRNTKKYGSPLPAELRPGYADALTEYKQNPFTGQVKKLKPSGDHRFLAYLPIIVFFIVVAAEMLLTWLQQTNAGIFGGLNS